MARLFRKKDESRKSLWERIRDVALTDVTVLARGGVDEGSLERLEELLIAADFGVTSTLRLVEVVETLAARGEARSHQDFLNAVKREIVAILSAGRADTALLAGATDGLNRLFSNDNPLLRPLTLASPDIPVRWTASSGPSSPTSPTS